MKDIKLSFLIGRVCCARGSPLLLRVQKLSLSPEQIAEKAGIYIAVIILGNIAVIFLARNNEFLI